MNCNNGCIPGNDLYADLKSTWVSSSSLNMEKWDPYPELQNPANCYGANCNSNSKSNFKSNREKYEGCCDGSAYEVDAYYQGKPPSNNRLNYSMVSSFNREGYENMNMTCCRPTSYVSLTQTWGVQKPFNLN